jgi:hypothetical protein
MPRNKKTLIRTIPYGIKLKLTVLKMRSRMTKIAKSILAIPLVVPNALVILLRSSYLIMLC